MKKYSKEERIAYFKQRAAELEAETPAQAAIQVIDLLKEIRDLLKISHDFWVKSCNEDSE